MRRETVELVRKAVTENWRAYVLVNHRSEGSAPLTISGTQRSTYECANMIESSICFLSGGGWRTERQLWQRGIGMWANFRSSSSIPGIGPSRKALYMKSWVKRRHTEIKGIPGISPQSCFCAS